MLIKGSKVLDSSLVSN